MQSCTKKYTKQLGQIFNLLILFWCSTHSQMIFFFILHKSKIPLGTWKARWSPLNMLALKLVGDLNTEEMLDLDIRVFDI